MTPPVPQRLSIGSLAAAPPDSRILLMMQIAWHLRRACTVNNPHLVDDVGRPLVNSEVARARRATLLWALPCHTQLLHRRFARCPGHTGCCGWNFVVNKPGVLHSIRAGSPAVPCFQPGSPLRISGCGLAQQGDDNGAGCGIIHSVGASRRARCIFDVEGFTIRSCHDMSL